MTTAKKMLAAVVNRQINKYYEEFKIELAKNNIEKVKELILLMDKAFVFIENAKKMNNYEFSDPAFVLEKEEESKNVIALAKKQLSELN